MKLLQSTIGRIHKTREHVGAYSGYFLGCRNMCYNKVTGVYDYRNGVCLRINHDDKVQCFNRGLPTTTHKWSITQHLFANDSGREVNLVSYFLPSQLKGMAKFCVI